MIRRIVCIAILLVSAEAYLSGQTLGWLVNERPANDYQRLVSVRNTPLFSKAAIKQEGIVSCLIRLHIPQHKYNKKETTDTVAVFRFDEEGNTCLGLRIRRREYPEGIVWDTLIGRYYPTDSGDRSDSLVSFRNGKKTVMTYYFLVYKEGSTLADTVSVRKEVFDSNNNLLEIKEEIPRDYFDYLCRTLCCNQEEAHKLYRYNRKGRIRFYQDMNTAIYTKFSYKPGKVEVRTFNASTHTLKERQTIQVVTGKDSIHEKLFPYCTLFRLRSNSDLFRFLKKDLRRINLGVWEYSFHYMYRKEQECKDSPETGN